MAIIRTQHLYEFLARVSTSPDTMGRVTGMHVVTLDRYVEAGVILNETPQPAQPVDFAGLVALMHPDDLAALSAAIQAAQP